MPRSPEHRLVTYGTLAPGQVNHGQLAQLTGTWSSGTVRGRLLKEGWGAVHDCPGIVLEKDGEAVEVSIFESEDLPAHWPRLDAFEGDEYRRTLVRVTTGEGLVEGYIYALAERFS